MNTTTLLPQEQYQDLGQVELKESSSSTQSLPSDLLHDKSRRIRLLQLTDLHIFPRHCKTFEGIPLDNAYQQCLDLIQQLIVNTTPDVIILTGDIMDGRGPWGTVDAVTQAIQDLLPLFGDIPWLYIPGNHDDDHSPWSRSDLMQILQLPGCLQRRATGFHHTLLLLKNNKDLRIRLHMFDSGGNHPNPKIMYECIPTRVVQEFQMYLQKTPTDTDTAAATPELVFLHIPTPEYQHVDPVVGSSHLFQAALDGGKVPFPWNKVPWLVRWLGRHRIAGCTRGPDSGLFATCVEANQQWQQQQQEKGSRQTTEQQQQQATARIISLFCGHDHHSDAVYWRQGIFLAYGRSGACTPPWDWEGKAPNPHCPGARVIEIRAAPDHSVTTWIETAAGMEPDSLLDMVRKGLVVFARRGF